MSADDDASGAPRAGGLTAPGPPRARQVVRATSDEKAMSTVEQVESDARAIFAPEPQAETVRAAIQACIDAMSSHIAILDRNGKILAVNQRWMQFASENRLRSPLHWVGDNYLTV